mmetsp:Transcript_72007/g.119890  ORF Transcript_72007/g.119890 Transcript_72007/m.119890 type:complete len:415 (-) Transcript_72007:135-1379(-)|eukprot:CAMPEP_0119345440 /NCGR_PEP_ID=MMETSP1333-20130426/107485_1 /TAXON_ID=418940 /ORGANISM="Scyphosphaera apsteinii, Strain RCC1455" /LENGTH=414 /DNA_ID=CAMNT_0007357909 /DNA_START=68 /DNA_END=1312 /DNA_ORIENTATION=-
MVELPSASCLKHTELQALAKKHGVKANGKKDAIVAELVAMGIVQSPEAPTAPETTTTPTKSSGTKSASSSTPDTISTDQVKQKTASRICCQQEKLSAAPRSKPLIPEETSAAPPSTPDTMASDKKVSTLGKASPTSSKGYAKIHSVRFGTKGLLPFACGSRLWGAQYWQTKEKGQLSVRLKRMDGTNGVADTLIVDCELEPLQVKGVGGAKVDFRFSLARLSAVDIHNGTCKLEFLRKADEKYTPPPGGPLVVLTFHERGVLTVEQFAFLAELTKKVESLGQSNADCNKKGVKLGLQSEVEWLPQRYTESSRRWLRLLLILLAAAAILPPTRKVIRWCTSPPVAAFADAMQLGLLAFLCELANWFYVGFGLLRSLIRGGRSLVASATAVELNVTVDGVQLMGGGDEKVAEKKKQ